MNVKGRFLVVLVEVAGAAWITYQQLPAHDQQRVRMGVYRKGMKIFRYVALETGRFAMRLERRYGEEVSSNG